MGEREHGVRVATFLGTGVKSLIAILVLLIALLQYRLWFGDGNLREFQRLHQRIDELKQDGAKRRDRNAALEAEVMDLKQGLDAIEERARQDLGIVKEGETFVQIIDAHHPPPAAEPPKPAAVETPAKPAESPPRKRRIRRKPEPEPEPTPPAEEPVMDEEGAEPTGE